MSEEVEEVVCEQAEAEIADAKHRCAQEGWTGEAAAALYAVFDRWIAHPRFAGRTAGLTCTVLNELTFPLDDEKARDCVWEKIRQLTRRCAQDDPDEPLGLPRMLIISTFELAAEAPEVGWFLELLFGLAADPDTRWAVFGAYENVPWRLRPHAEKYANGLITDKDCDEWLASRGLGDDEILMRL